MEELRQLVKSEPGRQEIREELTARMALICDLGFSHLARELTRLLGVPVTRSQQYKGGQHSADLIGAVGLHFEVKRTERLRLYQAMEQAAKDAGENTPIVLHRRNGKRWLAIVYLDDIVEVAGVIGEISDIEG